jgi:hypothetical protein
MARHSATLALLRWRFDIGHRLANAFVDAINPGRDNLIGLVVCVGPFPRRRIGLKPLSMMLPSRPTTHHVTVT